MKTQIQSVHFTADAALKDLLLEKVHTLEKEHKQIESCIITLRLEKNDQNKNKVVEINLTIPGARLFVEDRSEKFEISATFAVEEMKRQLQKNKPENRPQPKKNIQLTNVGEFVFM